MKKQDIIEQNPISAAQMAHQQNAIEEILGSEVAVCEIRYEGYEGNLGEGRNCKGPYILPEYNF